MTEYLGKHTSIKCYTIEQFNCRSGGSEIVKLIIHVTNNITKCEQTIHTVAKFPPKNESTRKIFNTEVTFKNEIEFYRTVIPKLRRFFEEHGLEPPNFFPDFVAGRVSFNGENVDDDAVLILEDLNKQDYYVNNCEDGFDLIQTKSILENLSQLHAVGIAMREQKPEEFEHFIRPYLNGITFGSNMEEGNLLKSEVKLYLSLLNENNDLKNWSSELCEHLQVNNMRRIKEDESYTIVHGDLWMNNIMLKSGNKKVIGIKIVDYQVCQFQSPLDDLIFFLMMSVQNEILNNHFDDLLQFYYKNFTRTLQKLKCTTNFSIGWFEHELKNVSKRQFFHSVLMLRPIFMPKGKGREPTVKLRQKFYCIMQNYIKKDWLK
ncbi:uncharacterized protein LOC126265934 [Aethina tumida]|uniref:uncharacterized protein LOC126265934 n=1 Tax=Aethina tumida TaxID=116153 RepID=UPI002147D2AD|nr:uncharacterized protein LOC126265934 [Aethina tumida]